MLHGSSCAVCGLADARALVDVVLKGADRTKVTLCGSHALVHRRTGERARTLAELRAMTKDRRARTRRAMELDELAASLSEAFAGERRRSERRSAS